MVKGFNEEEIQKGVADFFDQDLNWHTYYAFNTEKFGSESYLGRNDEKEIILDKYLKAAMLNLNPEAPIEAVEEAIKEFKNINISKSLLDTNEEKYKLIKNGVKVEIKNIKGDMKSYTLKLVDFDTPENNHFLFVRELWVKGDIYRRRLDGMGFVNGIPLVFMELKGDYIDIQRAYEDNYKDYLTTVPHIFSYNMLVALGNGNEGRYGTVEASYDFYLEWKRNSEKDEPSRDFKVFLKGLFDKERFLDLLENFILFDKSSGKNVKIIAKNHQYLGVNNLIENVKNRNQLEGKLGTFWHTQGSGKSYSMVFFGEKVHRKIEGSFTFVMLLDRIDLEKQLITTAAGTDAIKEGINPKASDGSHLRELLKGNPKYVFTIINKFNKPSSEIYSDSDEIIVVSDEAHRTQYGRFAENMRKALPNASFVGFTGTPLFSDDEITKKYFGDYVSIYDFKMAVEDKATVPIFYENRGEKLKIVNNGFNRDLIEKMEGDGLDDDTMERVQREFAKEYHIFTAESRLEEIAEDFVDHYTNIWESGKAMYVAIDKITALKMLNKIEKYWELKIEKLRKELETTLEGTNQNLKDKIKWMEETEIAIVVSEEQNEITKFAHHGLDIKPHRKKMKEEDLETKFKDPDSKFRVVIVCAMWLTGFDVKTLSTLYLDKPLKAHTLMQTIARVNRVSPGKNNGLIVDYNGILRYLREALAKYAMGDIDTKKIQVDPTNEIETLIKSFKEIILECELLISSNGGDISIIGESQGLDRISAIRKLLEAVLVNGEVKNQFKNSVTMLEKIKKFLGYNTELDDVIDKYIIFVEIKRRIDVPKVEKDLTEIIAELKSSVIDKAIEVSSTGKTTKIINLTNLNFERLKDEFLKRGDKNQVVNTLIQELETKVRKMVNRNESRVDLLKKYEEIIAKYNNEKERVSIEKTFEELMEFIKSLSEEEQRAATEGLTEEELAVFDLLKRPDLKKADREAVKKLSKELLAALKDELKKMHHWREKYRTMELLRTLIDTKLFDDNTGLPLDGYPTDEFIKPKIKYLFNHMYTKYESYNKNVYSEV